MGEKAPIQITAMPAGNNFTFSADSPEQMADLLAGMEPFHDQMAESLINLEQTFLAKGALQAPAAVNAAPKAGPAPQGSTLPPRAGSAPGDKCNHGRTQRSGNGAKGPWVGLFCNANSNDNTKHQPAWQNKDGVFEYKD